MRARASSVGSPDVASDWRVVWSPLALNDFDDIIDYIDVDSPTNARRVFAKLARRVRSLRNFPHRGSLVQGRWVHGGAPLRELVEGPWRIVYIVEDDRVLVMGIADGRRDIEAFLRQRFLGDSPTDN